ncbi:MAG: cobamide remodeling phosphodiesterase CbiR [Candidatus Omnitrophota bacterium]
MKRQEFSFKVGTTSYIYPENILPNVHKLKDLVDDIELVLFESKEAGNIPKAEDLTELKRVSNDWNLTYTVHLPLDINLGSSIRDERKNSVEKVRVFVEHFRRLKPYAYILHLNLPKQIKGNIKLWQCRINRSLEEISELQTVLPHNIVIENLCYPFSYIDTLILGNGFSICVDIGHLILMGVDPLKHLKKYFNATRLIHLHGVNGRRDHLSLKYFDHMLIRRIIRFLIDRDYRGVLTLEVFSQIDFEESMNVLWRNL